MYGRGIYRGHIRAHAVFHLRDHWLRVY